MRRLVFLISIIFLFSCNGNEKKARDSKLITDNIEIIGEWRLSPNEAV